MRSTATRRGSGVDAAKRAGITFRQVDYYLRAGFVTPEGAVVGGSGVPRELTDADIDALAVVGRLMAIRERRGDTTMRARLVAIAAHVQEHGAVGTFELIPGVTVDLERLLA
jgi:hypothetical protein